MEKNVGDDIQVDEVLAGPKTDKTAIVAMLLVNDVITELPFEDGDKATYDQIFVKADGPKLLKAKKLPSPNLRMCLLIRLWNPLVLKLNQYHDCHLSTVSPKPHFLSFPLQHKLFDHSCSLGLLVSHSSPPSLSAFAQGRALKIGLGEKDQGDQRDHIAIEKYGC
ncbi:hypothetical protein Aperf_G00000128312 [Anoplocephala perfoliata]